MRSKKHFPGRVIFDHLPKTAGQAVNAWLRKSLGEGCVTENVIGKHRDLIRRFGGDYSVISGHIEFFGEGFDPRYDYVTCFRHPLDRSISWLYFVNEGCNDADPDFQMLQAGVREFLQSEGEVGHSHVLANSFVTHLCSIQGDLPKNPAEQIDRALIVADTYSLWGIYEQLPLFANDLATLLGVAEPSHLERVNVTGRRPKIDQISPRMRAKLEELNAIDIAFYEKLVSRYEESRHRWQCVAPGCSSWIPLPANQLPVARQYCHPDFMLLRFTQEGGGDVEQNAVIGFVLEFSIARSVQNLECSYFMHDEEGRLAFSTNSTSSGVFMGALGPGTYHVNFAVATALPEGSYDVGFSFCENIFSHSQELAYLEKMGSIQIKINRRPLSLGYVSLPIMITHHHCDQYIAHLPADRRGRIIIILPALIITTGEQWSQPVELCNESENCWYNLHFTPLQLTYRWLKENGDEEDVDGLITSLNFVRLAKGEIFHAELNVQAPELPGRYKLQVLPVQENVAWCDEFGFCIGEMELEVVSHSMHRHYAATDCRLIHQVGQRTPGAITSDGREGFLVFGPYTLLAEGNYSIHFRGHFSPNDSIVKMEVAYGSGSFILAEIVLAHKCDLVTLEFSVAKIISDAEFRVWVSADAYAELSEIFLEPQQ